MGSKQTPPGPESKSFGLDILARFKNDPLETICALRDQFGDLAQINFGPVSWILASHPDLVKDVLVTGWRTFGKTDQFKRVLGSVDGKGLVLSEGDLWLRQRRIIQPSFDHQRLISDYASTMIFETRRHIAEWHDGMELDLHEEMTRITLKIASKIFFDIDATKESQELADSVSTISRVLYQEFSEIIPLPDWLPLPSKTEKKNAVDTIDRFIYKVIEKHKEEEGGQTVVSMLLNAKDVEGDGKPMSIRQVRDEAITMFNAGHDSTAAALSWTWYEVLRHPDIYRNVFAEIDSASRTSQSPVEILHKVPLVSQCIKESLRLYPPAWIIPRQCSADLELAGYHMKKGTLVNLSPYVIQRDSRFFANPNDFVPERFSQEKEKDHYPHSFFPFGEGPRSCIGRDFALMEMELVIVTIAREFEFELNEQSQDVLMNPMISLEPKDGIKANVKKRHSNDRKG